MAARWKRDEMAATVTMAQAPRRSAAVAAAHPAARLQNIDALRGFVMVVMLIDHLRETWFLHLPVADPVDARHMLPALFFARLAASICAPVFVALTGLGVYLFQQTHTIAETRAYLVRRGLLLMAFDVFYLSELYWGITTPTIWLQVIWCIGVCMLALAALLSLPRGVLLGLGIVIVGGHNLLDPIRLSSGDPLFPLWAMLHQRDAIALPFGLVAKTTYPVLAWVGVILLGYGIGPWFRPTVDPRVRQRRLMLLGAVMLVAFVAIRLANGYGDAAWSAVEGDRLRTVMSFLALTKYPPSLLFLLLTLGVGALLLVAFERLQGAWLVRTLAVFGGAPMFFYLLHLTMLRLLYHGAFAIWGATHGGNFGVTNYNWIFAWYAGLVVALYFPTAWFSRLKKRRRDLSWLRYF